MVKMEMGTAESSDDDAEMSEQNEEPETAQDHVVAEESEEAGPPPKKFRKDIGKEAEEQLQMYDAIAQDPSTPVNEKFEKFAQFANYLFQNNINTLQFEKDFAEWSKSVMLLLLDDVSETSVEYYDFLSSFLRVAPTIFEPVCEKLLSLSITCHSFSPECDLAFESFMEKLANTFEKLRRFPKLIAKLLHCVRDNMSKLAPNKSRAKRKSGGRKMKLKSLDEVTSFLLPKRFMDSYSSIVSLLPVGQIIDLWKTLHHNLDEECIKKFSLDSSSCLLSVVTELIVVFMHSIRVADYGVPSSTVSKVMEFMQKLKEQSMVQLGKEISNSYDANSTRSFLKLTNAWGNLHQLLIVYNENYKLDLPNFKNSSLEAKDLSLMFPFLSEDEWLSLWQAVEGDEASLNMHLMINLVALKLKLIAIIDRRRVESESAEKSLSATAATQTSTGANRMNNPECEDKDHVRQSAHARTVAKFLWDNQDLLRMDDGCSSVLNNEILDIALFYMNWEELSDFAKKYANSILSKGKPRSQEYSKTFHVAVVLELLHDGLKHFEKIKNVKRAVREFLNECLNSISKSNLLEDATSCGKPPSDALKTCLIRAVEIVNDVIAKSLTTKEQETAAHLPKLEAVISYLSQLELGQYPKSLKTLIFLASSLMFAALIGNAGHQNLVEILAGMMTECGRKSHGNEFVFQIYWTEMFIFLQSNSTHLSDNSCRRLCSLILENIFISPKVTLKFSEGHIKSVCDNLDLTTSVGQFSFLVLENILQELLGGKSKSTHILDIHVKELSNIAVRKLSDGTIISELHSLIRACKKRKKKDSTDSSSSFVSRVMQPCFLLLKGKSFMKTEDATAYNAIVLPYLQFALDFMEVATSRRLTKVKSDIDERELGTPLLNCRLFLIESLNCFEELRPNLPEDFLLRLWNCCVNESKYLHYDAGIVSTMKGALKAICEVVNEAEFQSVCELISEGLSSDAELISIAHVLNAVVDAEVKTDAKKQMRRVTVELCLFKYLKNIHLWKDASNLVEVAVPYIQFQTSLLRRRKPMGSLNAMAICLTSVTAVPLDRVEDVGAFKTVFLNVGDLLNSMAVHRLDVMCFRTHLFLQFLVESLVKRADQRNKLADGEIYDLRQCSHSVERICQSAKSGKQEFARVAPYLLVVLLQQFEKITIYPVIKNPLMNGCYKLLDMCDDNGISHMNSMLSAGSREIFKTMYDLYKSFYRYKGRV